MNREDLEHIIRAAGDVTDEYEFIIVGSQSILGPIPYPPDVFKLSAEADIYPRGCRGEIRTDLLPAKTQRFIEFLQEHLGQQARPSGAPQRAL